MIGSTLIASAMVAALAASSGVSGVYVGASASTVQLVQIVRTPDGRIAGRLEEVSLSADGATRDTTIALDGAADGDQIVLSPKSLLLSGNAASLTGFISSDILDLSWQGGHASLKRADAYAFEAAVTGLKARSAMILAEQEARAKAADHAAKIQTLMASAQALKDDLAELQRNMPVVEQRLAQTRASYEQLQMASSHDRLRQRAFSTMGGEFGLRTMQVGTDAQAVDVQLNGLHGDTRAFAGEVGRQFQAARSQLSGVELTCRALAGSPELAVTSTCGEAPGEAEQIDQMADTLNGQFRETEAAYQSPASYVPIGKRFVNSLLH